MSANEFKFYCSHCDQPLKCDPCHAGRQIQCQTCQHLLPIPNPPPATGFPPVQPAPGAAGDAVVATIVAWARAAAGFQTSAGVDNADMVLWHSRALRRSVDDAVLK